MRMYDLILKKKQGKELNTEEINWMIKEFTEGRIPDANFLLIMLLAIKDI